MDRDHIGSRPRLDASMTPGIREYYNPHYRRGLTLPLCFFLTLSLVFIAAGILLHFFARQLKDDINLPYKTYSSCLLSLGVILLLITSILFCEALLTGQCGASDVESPEERESLLSRSASVTAHRSETFSQEQVSPRQSRASSRASEVTITNPIPIITISPCADNPTINDNFFKRDKSSSLP